jgi:molybdopterin-guanine dinucleotide biosynthesis protein A
LTKPEAAFEEVTGAVLTGGLSTRLGRDKVLLPYQGKPLAAHVHGILSELFPNVLLIGHPRPELESLGLICIPDLIPGKGALGGIYTSLVSCRTPYVFIAAADMPFLTSALISRIATFRSSADAVIPMGPRGREPLCAVYSRTCVKAVRKSLDVDTLKVIPALEGLKIVSPEIAATADGSDPFVNINYPDDVRFLGRS